MRKISSIVKAQAHSQFNQKKQDVIKNILKKKCNSEKSFQEYMELYSL